MKLNTRIIGWIVLAVLLAVAVPAVAVQIAGQLTSLGPSVQVDRAPGTGRAVLATDGGSAIYAAYVVPQGGLRDVYFNRSTDGGQTFEAQEQHIGGISTSAWATYPKIAADRGGRVYVVWEDGRDGWHAYLNRSQDGGATFEGEKQVDDSASAGYPDVAADDDGHVYVARYEHWNVYPGDVWVDISADYGASFEIHRKVSDPVGGTISSIASDGAGNVYVVFAASRAYSDLYLVKSSDWGDSWTVPVQIGDLGSGYNTYEYWWLSANVEAEGDNVYVAWPSHVSGDQWDLYVATSTDRGTTFAPPIKINRAGQVSKARIPSLSVDANQVYLGWDDGPEGDHGLWVALSTDRGVTFAPPTAIDDSGPADLRAHWGGLVAGQSRLYALWNDDRDGDWHTYLARYAFRSQEGYRARVIVLNKAGERQPGYQITFYDGPGGSGEIVAAQTTGADGVAEIRLPNGTYSYVAHKGCYASAPVDFVVNRERVVISHKAMARVTIRVVDNAGIGRSLYIVRTYDAKGNPDWRRTSTGSGRTWFNLDVPAQHQFSVERSQLQSRIYPIGDGDLCGPAELRYTLATIEVHVTDTQGRDGVNYQVRAYNPGGRYYLVAYTRSNGVATLRLPDGEYEYTVRKSGVISAPRSFAIDPPQGGPGGVADDQRIEHMLD